MLAQHRVNVLRLLIYSYLLTLTVWVSTLVVEI